MSVAFFFPLANLNSVVSAHLYFYYMHVIHIHIERQSFVLFVFVGCINTCQRTNACLLSRSDYSECRRGGILP